MRGQTAIAQRYLSLLRRWRRLRRRAIRGSPSWEMVSLDSEVRALGWVLGADPRDGLGQPYGGTEMTVDGKPRLQGVRLTGVWQETQRFITGRCDTTRYWLLEVPASTEARTDYWAVFLTERQVADVLLSAGMALFGSAPDALTRMATAGEQADAPTVESLRRLVERTSWAEGGDSGDGADTQRTGGAA